MCGQGQRETEEEMWDFNGEVGMGGQNSKEILPATEKERALSGDNQYF